MLKKETILLNEALKGLTAEQITAIETLSANDEAATIAQKIGDLHGQYDADIKAVTGKEKPAGVKTYAFLKEVLAEMKTAAEAAETLKVEKAELEKKLKTAAGPELEKKILETEKLVEQLREQVKAKDKAIADAKEAAQNETVNMKVSIEQERALQGLKFKSEKSIPLAVREAFIDAAKAKVAAKYKPSFISEAGGQRLVYLDEKGEILRNPATQLHPFTTKELLSQELKEILDERQQTGTGTDGGGDAGGFVPIDLSGVKTKAEADERIEKHLLDEGMVKTDPAFAAKHIEIRKAANIDKLPVR